MPSRVLRRLVVPVVAAAAAVAWFAPNATAYEDLFHPIGKPGHADPCAQVGDGGGTIIKRNVKPSAGSNDAVDLTMLCGPRVNYPNAGPFPSTLLWDDAVWQRYMGRSGGPPGHAMSGGEASVLWNRDISTLSTPWLKGPNGGAPDEIEILKQEQLNAVVKTLVIVAGISFASAITGCVSLASVAIPIIAAAIALGPYTAGAVALAQLSLVIKCSVAIVAAGGVTAFFALFTPIVAGAAKNLWDKFLGGRIDIMSKSDWFAWSSGLGGWNTFGDIGPRYINPSLYGIGGYPIRVGVVFANTATTQGPRFADAKADSAEPQPSPPSPLATPAERRKTAAKLDHLDLVALMHGKRAPRDEAVYGFNGYRSGGRHVKHGRPGNDYMYAGKGTVTLDGGRGNNTLRAGPGDDTLVGGPRADKLFGNTGHVRIDSRGGNDLIVARQGPSDIDTGSGRNVVDIRGHRGHDTIACPGSTGNHIMGAKSGDAVAANCHAH